MKKDNLTFVVKCDTCQQNKGETVKTPRALQRLSIPPTLWTYILMDFIMGLLKAGNKSFIMVVVDELSKYHFCALQHPFTLASVAQFFWTRFLNFMACLLPLYLIMTPLFVRMPLYTPRK